ncbi:MAG: phospholipase D-like domain-containing protein [Candidatus Micrarchaeaceae archaeon]
MLGKERISYSGNESYRYLKLILNDDGPLLVVSPYIDAYYASALRRISAEKKIYIITSSMESNASTYLTQSRISWELLLLALVFLAIALAVWYVSLLIYIAAVLVVGLVSFIVSAASFAVFLLKLKYRKPSNIILRVPASFVHAKMYIGRGAALYGSANLTYAGMHKNVEHMELTYNKDEIKDLSNQFWELWRNASKK